MAIGRRVIYRGMVAWLIVGRVATFGMGGLQENGRQIRGWVARMEARLLVTASSLGSNSDFPQKS